MEPLQVAERCVVTDAEALIVDTTELICSLFDELRTAGREVLSPVFCIRVASPPPDLPQAKIVEVPDGEFAVVTHIGPYEQLGLGYHALYAWAQEHGHETRGLVREIYVNDPANVRPEALQTDLLLPL